MCASVVCVSVVSVICVCVVCVVCVYQTHQRMRLALGATFGRGFASVYPATALAQPTRRREFHDRADSPAKGISFGR